MEKFIHGMDISSMDEVVGLGGKYYDKGEERELTDILKSYGVNYIRLRLWLNPYTQEGASYGAGANDLNTTLRMIKRVKAAGFKYLLDFHYSDFWTDPGKQIKPKIWKDYGPAELEVALYEYTKETLLGLKAEGCLPDMVQVGNEITNGILWPEGQVSEFEQLTRFISAGIRGVRKVSRDIPVMLHLDQGNKHKLYQEWFDNYKELGGEEFDIIGLSYYPVWNGRIKGLIENMNALADRYGKRMIVVEVSQPPRYVCVHADERQGF